MSQRRIDVEGLLSGPSLLPLRHHRDRPHVVEAVGQLDHEDAPVARHRDQHLADGGGLLSLLRVELEPVELGDPVDDPRHLGPEPACSTSSSDRPVSSTASWSMAAATDRGSRPRWATMLATAMRVGDVRLPRMADLAAVDLVGEPPCPHHKVAVVVNRDLRDEPRAAR